MHYAKLTRLVVLTGALLAGVVASGCNTVEGFGKDVEKLGDKIEDKAAEKRKYDNVDND